MVGKAAQAFTVYQKRSRGHCAALPHKELIRKLRIGIVIEQRKLLRPSRLCGDASGKRNLEFAEARIAELFRQPCHGGQAHSGIRRQAVYCHMGCFFGIFKHIIRDPAFCRRQILICGFQIQCSRHFHSEK